MEANFQQYKEQAINTMTQGELLLLLYDELVKHLTRAGLALDKEQYEILETSVQKSVDIIHYLDNTLDRKYPISQNLHQLYEYFCYELSRVRIGRNKTELERVKGMVQELRESFREVEKSNDSGK
ncbi:MAG: flagellar export chaperone FliS [Acutalibacter sp.]|jgi:flagellar protein FliS